MSPENFDDVTDLEAALKRLSPSPVRLDRDRLMFQAGGLASRQRFWPIVSGALAAAAALLVVLLIQRPGPQIIERVVYVPPPPPASKRPPAHPKGAPPPAPVQTARAPAPVEYESHGPRQALEEQLLRWGLDGLPQIAPGVPSEPPLATESLLGLPVKAAARSGLFPLGSWFHEGNRS